MNKEEAEVQENLAKIGRSSLSIVGTFLVLFLKSLVLSDIWSWYFVAHFKVAPLPMIVAFGIVSFTALVVPAHIDWDSVFDEEKRNEMVLKKKAMLIFAIIVAWGIAKLGSFFV